MSTPSDGAHAATSDDRDRERDAEDQHHLAAVAVAERAEPEHRRGEAERVADGDEVESGLRRRRTSLPMSGSATFATARFRLATAATRMSARSTRPWRSGAVEVVGSVRWLESAISTSHRVRVTVARSVPVAESSESGDAPSSEPDYRPRPIPMAWIKRTEEPPERRPTDIVRAAVGVARRRDRRAVGAGRVEPRHQRLQDRQRPPQQPRERRERLLRARIHLGGHRRGARARAPEEGPGRAARRDRRRAGVGRRRAAPRDPRSADDPRPRRQHPNR